MRIYRLTGRGSFGEVETLAEYESHDDALASFQRYRREGYFYDLRIDEYVDGVWQHRPTPPPERRILKPTNDP